MIRSEVAGDNLLEGRFPELESAGAAHAESFSSDSHAVALGMISWHAVT